MLPLRCLDLLLTLSLCGLPGLYLTLHIDCIGIRSLRTLLALLLHDLALTLGLGIRLLLLLSPRILLTIRLSGFAAGLRLPLCLDLRGIRLRRSGLPLRLILPLDRLLLWLALHLRSLLPGGENSHLLLTLPLSSFAADQCLPLRLTGLR